MITVITALKLIQYNTDSEVATIIKEAIDELDRLTRLEKYAIEMARAALEGNGVNDRQAAWEIIKLTNTQVTPPVGDAEWAALNRAAR